MALTIKIEEKDIEQASSFVPVSQKYVVAALAAKICVETVPKKQNPWPEAPDRFRENRMLRHMVMMGILAKFYLNKEFEPAEISYGVKGKKRQQSQVDFMMDGQTYDEWAGSHVINQLERLKKSKERATADKVFDILYDYKAFENMVFGAIRDELELRNDVCGRLGALLSVQVTPADMQRLIEEVKAMEGNAPQGEKNV